MRGILGLIFLLTIGIGYSIFLVAELFIERKKEKERKKQLVKITKKNKKRTRYGATYFGTDYKVFRRMCAIPTGQKINGRVVWVEYDKEKEQPINTQTRYLLKTDLLYPCSALFIKIKD